MENTKGRIKISSLEELSSSQQKHVEHAAAGIGLLAMLNYFLLLLLYFGIPNIQSLASLETVGILIFLCLFSSVPFLIGHNIGRYIKLADMGYTFSKPLYANYSFQNPSNPFVSDLATRQTRYFHESYVSSPSINPSSGLPMSGSSGIDISGNPYGSNSWHSFR